MKLLFIEDNTKLIEQYRFFFEEYFSKIYDCVSIKEGFKIFKEVSPDVIISDIEVTDGNSLDYLKSIRKIDKNVSIIITSAYKKEEYLFKAIELNLTKYLVKPISYRTLKRELDKIKFECRKDLVVLKESYIWNKTSRKLFFEDKEIKLTKNEILIFEEFCKKDLYFSFEDIFYYIYDDLSGFSENKVKMIIKRLRKKTYKDIVINTYALGYRFNIK